MILPLVVIPTKDNETTIVEVVKGSLAHCPDVLVLDDGCTDNTAALAKDAGAIVVSHAVNQGKGAALATALQYARQQGFTHIIAIDADGQHKPEDIPDFIAACEREPAAIFAGVRDLSTAPESSRFGRRFSNFWIRVETGWWVGDSQCGFRSYPVDSVLNLNMRPGRYEWEVEVLVRALWNGIPVRDIPCQVYYPTPEERVSSFRPVADNVRISLLNTRFIIMLLLWPPLWLKRFRSGAAAPLTWTEDHRGFLAGWRATVHVIRIFGRWPAYAAMVFPTTFYFLISGANRSNVMSYLHRRFPDAGVVSRAIKTWRIFFNFAIVIVDRLVLLTHGPEVFTLIKEYDDEVWPLRDSDEGFLIMASHQGNAELGGAALSSDFGERKVSLVQYTKQGDAYIQMMREFRGDKAPELIGVNDDGSFASLSVVRALREGGAVALKADRVVDSHVARPTMFGAPVLIPTGPFLLGALSKAPVLWMGCFKEGWSTYRVIIKAPKRFTFESRARREAQLQEWAGEFAEQMEEYAERYPLQYYNFHDAWKAK